MLNPTGRVKITKWIDTPNPLGKVNIEEIVDVKVQPDELDLEQGVTYQRTQQLMHDIARYTQNPHIIGAANISSRATTVNDFIQVALAVYELISRIVEPALGTAQSREAIQDIFAETNLTERLQKLCMAFTGMRKRIDIINKLEIRAAAEHRERAHEEEATKAASEKGGAEGGRGAYGDTLRMPVDDRVSDVKRFRKNMEGKRPPPLVQKRFEEEVSRYLSIDPHHSESSVLRTYLDHLTALPWGTTTVDSFDVKKAKEQLDMDHYGMDEIKQRVLEFLSVGKLQNKVQGKILCFVGPPGVGKTSIGASIAKLDSERNPGE